MKKTVRTILFAAATLAAVSCGNKKTEQAAPVAEVAPSVTVVTVNEREVIQQQTFPFHFFISLSPKISPHYYTEQTF